ncbi:serpin-ZX-like [Lolium rigidum]|uniref:serpin-ZX-like n=1 Tax=Lolium rigidum TaxID=89674 RepID=UPI001F5CDF7A|nr:serpin-ZX-like [Lolium rigidum]
MAVAGDAGEKAEGVTIIPWVGHGPGNWPTRGWPKLMEISLACSSVAATLFALHFFSLSALHEFRSAAAPDPSPLRVCHACTETALPVHIPSSPARRSTTSATDIAFSITQQTRFALRLASAISSSSNSKGSSGNTAFSPLSLHVSLSLVAAGAGGATRDQLAATLGAARPGKSEALQELAELVVQLVLSDASGAGGPRVAYANGVFVDASLSLKPSFQDLAVGKYNSKILSVDFKTKAAEVSSKVNSWVEKITAGLIKKILPAGSVDATTSLVLGNALYFKGAWTQKFDASKTKDGKFHLLDGSSVQAPFMSSTKKQYLLSSDSLKVLKLPYQQGRDKRQFSMYILLPEAHDGLSNLAEKLSTERNFIEMHIPEKKVPVGQFKLPKFKISFGFEASDLLKGLGLQLPFSAEADLSEIVGLPVAKSLYISSLLHKSFVEVNEEGTEAAAATAAAMVTLRSRPVEPKMDFVADHPFLFLIREDITGVVLFIGHVANPLMSS